MSTLNIYVTMWKQIHALINQCAKLNMDKSTAKLVLRGTGVMVLLAIQSKTILVTRQVAIHVMPDQSVKWLMESSLVVLVLAT